MSHGKATSGEAANAPQAFTNSVNAWSRAMESGLAERVVDGSARILVLLVILVLIAVVTFGSLKFATR